MCKKAIKIAIKIAMRTTITTVTIALITIMSRPTLETVIERKLE